jgi:hypothetical protein
MSALPPKVDIHQGNREVCFVPKAAIGAFEHIIGPDSQDLDRASC